MSSHKQVKQVGEGEQRLQSVSKAIAVLKCFNPLTPELTPAEVSQRLGVHRVTAFRLLEALARAQLLDKSAKTGRYSVGPTLYVLGNLYLTTKDTLKEAEPVVRALNELTGEVVVVGIREDGYVTLVMREESKHDIRLHYHIGSTFPAYANATGKASLAALPDDEIDRLFPAEELRPLTSRTVPTRTALRRELRLIRKRGYALVKEQAREGVCSAAALIRDVHGEGAAAMSIALPMIRSSDAKLEALGELVKLGAGLISYRLGYRGGGASVPGLTEIQEWWEKHKPA